MIVAMVFLRKMFNNCWDLDIIMEVIPDFIIFLPQFFWKYHWPKYYLLATSQLGFDLHFLSTKKG